MLVLDRSEHIGIALCLGSASINEKISASVLDVAWWLEAIVIMFTRNTTRLMEHRRHVRV